MQDHLGAPITHYRGMESGGLNTSVCGTTRKFSWSTLQLASELARGAAEDCLVMGMCWFSSTEAMQKCLPSLSDATAPEPGDFIDIIDAWAAQGYISPLDTAHTQSSALEWLTERRAAMFRRQAATEPIKPPHPHPPCPSAQQQITTSSTTATCTSGDVALVPSDAFQSGHASSLLWRWVSLPQHALQTSAQHVVDWAWTATTAVVRPPSWLRGIAWRNATSDISAASAAAPDAASLMMSSSNAKEGKEQRVPFAASLTSSVGVLLVPALDRLALHILQNVAKPRRLKQFGRIFTTEEWTDMLLHELGVRHVEIVTRFLCLSGALIAVVPDACSFQLAPHCVVQVPLVPIESEDLAAGQSPHSPDGITAVASDLREVFVNVWCSGEGIVSTMEILSPHGTSLDTDGEVQRSPTVTGGEESHVVSSVKGTWLDLLPKYFSFAKSEQSEEASKRSSESSMSFAVVWDTAFSEDDPECRSCVHLMKQIAGWRLKYEAAAHRMQCLETRLSDTASKLHHIDLQRTACQYGNRDETLSTASSSNENADTLEHEASLLRAERHVLTAAVLQFKLLLVQMAKCMVRLNQGMSSLHHVVSDDTGGSSDVFRMGAVDDAIAEADESSSADGSAAVSVLELESELRAVLDHWERSMAPFTEELQRFIPPQPAE